MIYKITAKFFFDNGEVKKVDWLEPNLVKKDSTPFSKEEVEMHFRSMFLRYMKEGNVLTIPNVMGKVSFIPFSKLYYAELSVSIEGEEDSQTPPPKPEQSPETKNNLIRQVVS